MPLTADQLLDEELELEQELAVERARTSLLGYVTATNDAYEVNWHHRRICTAIDALQNGWTHRELLAALGIHGEQLRAQLETPHPNTGLFAGLTHPSAIDAPLKNLHIAVPPRAGKTTLASIAAPAFAFGKNPDEQIISTSYSADLSSRINRQVQREIDNPIYKQIFPNTALSGSAKSLTGTMGYQRNSDLFEIVDHRGVYRSAGVSGGVTGMGATCLVAGTIVATEKGPIPIEKFITMQTWPRVWSYSHDQNSQKLCEINAVQQKTTTKVVRVQTLSGHALTCTPEHLVFTTNRGYRAASLIEACDHLRTIQASWKQVSGEKVCELRKSCGLRKHVLQKMLQRHASKRLCHEMRALRKTKNHSDIRISKSSAELPKKLVLQQNVSVHSKQCSSAKVVSCLWRELDASSKKMVLRRLSRLRAARKTHPKKQRVQVLRPHLQTAPCRQRLLWNGMQKQSTFRPHDRESQPVFSPRQKQRGDLPSYIQKDSSFYFIERQTSLLLLREIFARKRRPYSSHRRERAEQLDGQFVIDVRLLPHSQSQKLLTQATVTEVRDQAPRYVYDLEVAECHNFFANGILVHNCAIIDDPVKNREQADSQVIRESIWEWYASTLYTRLHKGAVKLLILTRWHEDDLAGRILAQAKADQQSDQWFGLIFPAILDAEPTPGDPRCIGEALWPSHFPLSQMLTTRATIGTYEFEALYQQRPAPREGGIIKTAWLQYYTKLPDGLTNYTMSADLTFGSRTSNKGDFVAIQMWACAGADRYLVDQIHARMEFTEQIRALKAMSGKYPMCRVKLIEDAANGRAAISVLRSEIQGLIPVRPIGSKQARLEAVSPQVESGNVYLPDASIAPWVRTNTHELASFPNGAHDDTLDAMVYALARLSPHKKPTFALPVSLTKTSAFSTTR